MATLKQVSNEIIQELSAIDKLPRFLGASLFAETKDRIFTKGTKSDGNSLGVYDLKTQKSKKRRGRFTSTKINLRDTDTLANSYTWEVDGKEVLFGFLDVARPNGVTNEKLRGYLEERYGDIFALTNKEVSLADDLIDDFINGII